MPAPTTPADLAAVLRKSKLLPDPVLDEFLAAHPHLQSAAELVQALQTDGRLTRFQADQLLKGRHKGFVLGRYTLLDRIGMGGMGQVYLAEHAAMRRRVAVKVLPPDRGASGYARERFVREARAAAALEHPHLVRAFDVDMDGDVAFLVMEYIDGVNLHELVSRRGPLAPARAAQYLWQVAAGLTAVHERALVHRDIKPANLLLDRAGVVRILDLGLVRSQLDDDALTRGEGAKLVGTADYLAPEQAVNSSAVDGRADLYSLGCTGYYLLVGEAPFAGGKTSNKLIAHQATVAAPVHARREGIPAGLSAVVSKLMAKKPADRYQTAAELMAALEPYAAGPVLPPDPADFPAAPTGGAPVTGVSSRVTLGGYTGSSSAGGSALRFTPDPTRWPVPSPSNQPTAEAGLDDTLPVRPAAVPAAEPAPVPAPPADPRVPVSDERDKVAALFGIKRPEPEAAGSAVVGYQFWAGVAVTAGLAALAGVVLLAVR